MQETSNVNKQNWATKLMAIVVVVSMVGSTIVLFAPEASARTGSDSYGYTFKDSSEAGLDASWTELIGASGTTTLLTGSTDAGQGPYDLPFTFELYENEYTTWGNGGDNGYITLGGAISYQWTSYHIPATQLGNAAVAGAWFDGGFCRTSNPTAGVYYNTIGTEPNRQFVVQYQDQGAWYPSVYQCPGTAAANAMTWQIILHEGSNKISVNYKDTDGGYSSDNEQATTGIQGKPGGNSVGLEYIYRNSPVAFNTLDDGSGTTVEFSPPPPARNDLRLKSASVPDPISLASHNPMTATVSNYGVNCDTAGDCTPVAETGIDVTAKVFSIKEETTDYTFDDRADSEGFTSSALQGANQWTQALNDGKGNHNEGDEGTDDGAWSSGRKSGSLGGMFKDNQKIHYDGTDILIADKGSDSVTKLSTSTDTVSTIIAASYTYLNDVIDVTEDGTNYYTLARTSGTYSSTTKVCKWAMSDTSSPSACNTTSVRYGTALTTYGGEVFVLQTSSSSSYRKVIVLDATDMTKSTDFAYSNGVSAYSYTQDIDVDEDSGDLYISYRDYYGRIREYQRDSGGDYSASSYSQTYMYSRYHSSVTVADDYVYTTGYYYSSYYGGIKRLSTSGGSVTTLFSSYATSGYKSSMAVTSSGDIYVASNYAYNYYSFYNWDDKIWIHEGTTGGSDYSSTASQTLGPNPSSLSALASPVYDASAAVGMTMSFKTSWQFYYLYEGALMESSVDGGTTWNHVPQSAFTQGGYYGTGYNYYDNPMDVSKDQWTYYNTNNAYTYNTNTAPWKTHALDLTSYAGYSAVQFRWVVGFNAYDNTYYYDSYFRLDDVSVTMKVADVTFAEQTKTIASLGFKEEATVTFFEEGDTTTFKPMDLEMKVGDKIGILINVPDNGGDQDLTNQRDVQFREVKYVIFSDNFEDGDASDWEFGKIRYGSGESWAVRGDSVNSGSYSMDSGHRNQESPLPADNYAATPSMDLALPVEASLQMYISYYAYYTYDGFQVQASPDGGTTWSTIEPDADNEKQYYVIYNYAYYNNPLRGQKGYAYYGSSTGFTYSPDPQGFKKATFDLTEFCGNSDVKVRFVTGWGTLPTSATYFDSFMRVDDVAVTGLVYNNNVGLNGFDLPDPLGVDETIAVETNVINAGLIDQDSGATKVRLQLGPLGIEEYETSDDLESYTDEAAAISAGWSTSDDCNVSSCGNWGYYGGDAGFILNTDEGDSGTDRTWGPDGGEFQMYYGGGSTEVVTPALDFSTSESDLSLTLKHRYNFDYYSGYTSYNGGQVQISVDGGTTYAMFEPSGGYPGTMYNYAGYGNPLYGQKGFVHCSDCSGVSGSASDDEDKYITSTFDMAAYAGMDDVRLKFVAGMYSYQWPGDGEHWHIDSLSFTGTGMGAVVKEQVWEISGSGDLGEFESGESQTVGLDYYFQVPGQYKIVFDTWIGSNPSSGIDEFAGDNSLGLARETMFTVAETTADDTTTQKKIDDDNRMMYSTGWSAKRDNGPDDGFLFRPSATTGADSAPVWWSGPDSYGQSYSGDDSSLYSPVFDLSTATSAKLVFNHKYAMHGYEYSWANYYYDGARVEISTDGGSSWDGLAVTDGEGYGGTVYNYAYYGNPLRSQEAFVMSSGAFVTTECRLDSYTGAGFDNLQIRFRLGGTFFNNPTSWEIDDVGIYGLGFDLAMTSGSTPYTLEVGEETTFTTSFKNQGAGDLGPSGAVTSAFATAYVNNVDGTEVWSADQTLGSLAMAYYDESGNTFAGESTDVLTFNWEADVPAGVYTSGVKITNADGSSLSDLFTANNDASHMLIVGKSAEMGDPLLTGGENWAATDNEPAHVGDGAMGVTWDQTGIATDTLDVSIGAAGVGYTPESPTVQLGTTVKWTNSDSQTHTVTDKNSQFDSFDIATGESFEMTFNEVGIFNYYCKYHPMMEGSITVVSSQDADEMVRTNFVEVWSKESFLVFWANFDMSGDSSVSVYAQKKGSSLEDSDSLGLWSANGFTLVDGMDHEDVGDSLTDSSDGWNPYYISLDSKKLGYNSLEYDPADDNAYSFVFRARGVEGTAHIGGVQLIRTLDTGFFMTKDDVGQLTYDIFPSLAVEMDYFVKNIGTVENTFSMTPDLNAQGKDYSGEAFDISINVMMNGEAYDAVTTSQNEDGTWTHAFDMHPDDAAMVTVRFVAPDYDADAGEPAGNRKFDVIINGYDTGSDESLREPVAATLFIKPSQFVLGEMTFDRAGVIEGDTLDITVKAWNEGNYASDVLVVFYVMDPTGDAYSTPTGTQRMTRVASTTIDVMAPKPVLENDGVYQTWYFATATWDEAFIPGTTVQDFETVEMYAEINPLAEEQDKSAGIKAQDEYLNQKDDNDAVGQIAVVKNKASTPSFAVGIIGLAVAAMVAAIGASLRREEE